ncbi:DegT/DnrJ/EryC1/StrS family aminotransferase [Planococcus sp. FY231025]|uniref:DegT/DnrJ/EryC1/StrS family aminotransferase n=1 Tax=Planococcus sp. FY231025 TaxID=3455699 RepID=UPI003F91ACA4
MKILPIEQNSSTSFFIPAAETKEKILLSTPHMTGNEMKYIQEAFDSNWIAPVGPNVDKFEEELAAYTGAAGGAALSSGTAAIHLALHLLGIGKGDRVFCSSLTFVASANPILYEGAEPVFIDAEEETWNMSPVALRKAFRAAADEGKLPKAVVVVNLYGQSAQMDELLEICNEYGVPIVEDAAESLGSSYKGKSSGTFGKFGIFSFNGNKIITASSGGMLISNDTETIKKARFLASQAKDPAPYYKHHEIGYNYRLSNVLAGIGRAQLEAIDERVAARRAVYERYVAGLGDIEAIEFQPEPEGTFSNRWLTAFTLNPDLTALVPENIKRALAAEEIESRNVWNPLHSQELFKDAQFFSHGDGEAVSEKIFRHGLCLPSGSNMTEEQQERVIRVIRSLFNN